MDFYEEMGISKKVQDFGTEIQQSLKERFVVFDEIAE